MYSPTHATLTVTLTSCVDILTCVDRDRPCRLLAATVLHVLPASVTAARRRGAALAALGTVCSRSATWAAGTPVTAHCHRALTVRRARTAEVAQVLRSPIPSQYAVTFRSHF